MSNGLSFFLGLLVVVVLAPSKATNNVVDIQKEVVGIGRVMDYSSRVGKEQKVAMEIALRHTSPSNSTAQLGLRYHDTSPNSTSPVTAAINLIKSKAVQVIIGMLTTQEAALISEVDNTTKNLPYISLITPATSQSVSVPHQSASYFQMANDIIFHMQCIAVVVGHFRWRKVTAIHEQSSLFSTGFGFITHLSDSLRVVNSEIEHHAAFPSLSSLSDPHTAIEEELKKLQNKSNRVFIVVQFSFQSAVLLFEKAKQMGMMENGYVWIIADEISSFLGSVDSSVMHNMQGVIGIKTSFPEKTKAFKQFKIRFRRLYGLLYPEEENTNPSIFALRAYDAVSAISKASKKFKGNVTSKEIAKTILSSDFKGLSGIIRFKNGVLSEIPTFQIINVVGKSYRQLALWSPGYGFSEYFVEHDEMKLGMDDDGAMNGTMGPLYWPGGRQTVPRGWTWANGEAPLRIGVPSRGAFNQFVRVSYEQDRNQTSISGFSIEVFEAVVGRLPYQLPYFFVSFSDSYDELVKHVHSKKLDAAVGDIEIMAYRSQYVDFSQPYVSSGLVMIVKVEPDRDKETWMFMRAYTQKMWLLIMVMHLSICSVVWLIENEHVQNPEFKGLGAMLWGTT
ncbi:glutamate receptor 2.7 [Ziziphus jujuba]|uniref:Glutamate receptor 2.7 n=1 Tax=Ziziphus jujuba TaxID=326968 RepID=A0ABM4A8F3_ZIZJJ|nr:glutamate receptor 2.7 [Ziziphus jujuba]